MKEVYTHLVQKNSKLGLAIWYVLNISPINVMTIRGGQNRVQINPIGFWVDRVGEKLIRTQPEF